MPAPESAQAAQAVPPRPTIDAKHQAEIDRDIADGAKYAEQVDKELKPSKNEECAARVQRIGSEVAALANTYAVTVSWGDHRLSPFPYSFKVVEGDDVNAFSLPGGRIYVYEGLVKFAETDDELAGVLAHEVSHAAFRHIATMVTEQSKMEKYTIPLILAAILAGGAEGSKIAQGASLVNQAFTSGWSLKAETAADLGAVQYLQKSKYNPIGVLTLMERLAYKERMGPRIDWGIFRTHPPSAERAAALTQSLNTMGVPIRRSLVSTSLRSAIKPGENGHVELWFGVHKLYDFGGTDALERADNAVLACNAFFDALPAVYELRLKDKTTLTGKGRKLLDVVADDVTDTNFTLEQATQNVMTAFRRAVYDTAYRVWDPADLAGS